MIQNKIKTTINFREIRMTLKHHSKTSCDKLLENKNDFYRVDRSDAWGYFNIMPKWREKIYDYFSEMNLLKEPVLYVDICGRASGASLGAHQTYCFSFKTPSFLKESYLKNNIFLFDGDLFNEISFSNF